MLYKPVLSSELVQEPKATGLPLASIAAIAVVLVLTCAIASNCSWVRVVPLVLIPVDKVKISTQPSLSVLRCLSVSVLVSAHNIYGNVVVGSVSEALLLAMASNTLLRSVRKSAPVWFSKL